MLRAWQNQPMRNLISTHIIALQTTASAEGPEWLHVLPTGNFSGMDGRGPYLLQSADAVIAAFNETARKIPVDENHSTDLAGKQGFSAPARGWIVELQNRDDGIWGRVEWTAEGRSLVVGQSYGYLSPVFTHSAKKPFIVQKLLRVALTNDPNLNLTSLHSTNTETTMDLNALREALGLPETADAAAILAAVAAAHTAQAAHSALVSRLAPVAGVAADASADAIITALQAKAKPATAVESENAELRTQVKTLSTQLETFVTTHAKERAESVIDAAVKEGKVVPALRDHMIARHSKNPTEVEDELKLMVSINAGGLGGRKLPEGETATTEELSVASMMGIDPEAFKKEHKSLFGKGQ